MNCRRRVETAFHLGALFVLAINQLVLATPYVLFSVSTPHNGAFDPTTLCQNEATARGLGDAGSVNWALVTGVSNLGTWSLTKNVVGPTGIFIATSQDFKEGTLNNTLSDAGVCSGEVWTGLRAFSWNPYSSVKCGTTAWSIGTSANTGHVASCTQVGESGDWIDFAAVTCDTLLTHLCVHEGPTRSPTKSPSKSPTKSPSRSPTKSPSRSPSRTPSRTPSRAPTTSRPTHSPTVHTSGPSAAPIKGSSSTDASNIAISQGGAVGIGIGAGAALLFVLVLVVILVRRKNSEARRQQTALTTAND